MEGEGSVTQFATPNARALSPRFAADSVLYLSTKGGSDGLWQTNGDVTRELWKGSDGGLVAPPAVSPDGTQIAFAYRLNGRAALHVMSATGTDVRTVTDSVDVRGTFSWSPDGRWIAFAGSASAQATRVYKVAASGGAPVPLANAISARPLWSPDGRFIVYSEPVQGARVQVRAVTPDGKPFPLPEMWVNYQTGTPYRFVPGAAALVYLKEGDVRHQNFFRIDLTSGEEQQLTDLQPGVEMRDFDVSPDGRQILFDRLRDNSDIVLMELRR
jgi:Tol biopolymer transport system component